MSKRSLETYLDKLVVTANFRGFYLQEREDNFVFGAAHHDDVELVGFEQRKQFNILLGKINILWTHPNEIFHFSLCIPQKEFIKHGVCTDKINLSFVAEKYAAVVGDVTVSRLIAMTSYSVIGNAENNYFLRAVTYSHFENLF